MKTPLISNVCVENVTAGTADIAWETDIAARSLVEYWEVNSQQRHTARDNEAVTLHSVSLSGLASGTEYGFQVMSLILSGGESAGVPGFFSTGPAAVLEGAQPGCRAPDFTFVEINGSTISRGDYPGKWLVLVFWETTCSACRAQLTHLQRYYEELPADVALLSLNIREETDILLLSLLRSRGVTYPVLMDRDGAVARKYEVTSWPCTFFIDTEGIIRKVVQGCFDNAEEIAAALSAARAGR